MARKTLVAVDDSPQAEAALAYALEAVPDAAITAIHVVQIPEGYWTAFSDSTTRLPGYDDAVASGEQLLESAVQTAADESSEIDTVIETGKPSREIVDYAVDEGFDQIVVGSYGRHGVDRVMLGSVSEAVVRRAPMTVIVIRES